MVEAFRCQFCCCSALLVVFSGLGFRAFGFLGFRFNTFGFLGSVLGSRKSGSYCTIEIC